MATIKSYTDLEQSKKLAKILPLESADMHYNNASIKGINYVDEYRAELMDLHIYHQSIGMERILLQVRLQDTILRPMTKVGGISRMLSIG